MLEPCAIGGGERVREFERRHSGRQPLRDHKDRQSRHLGASCAEPKLQDTSIGDWAGLSARSPEAPNSANKRGNMEHRAALTLHH
ncbi:hypothetical protein NDU88_004558 [Pleurodeles waltl]|uniref:Uncharacterized protein n=1 Tax=Pleurodeles waltl TaxID=8319 RepID=A0AAV7VHG2_PLEWA|nr:hypothetical protein NDU88_004558 [Pleurodeles waltl]